MTRGTLERALTLHRTMTPASQIECPECGAPCTALFPTAEISAHFDGMGPEACQPCIDSAWELIERLAEEREARIEAEADAATKRALIDAAGDRIASALRAAGMGVETEASRLSGSRYVVANKYDADDDWIAGLKIRIADHDLPPTYGRLNGYADIEIAIGRAYGPEVHYAIVDDDDLPGAVEMVVSRAAALRQQAA